MAGSSTSSTTEKWSAVEACGQLTSKLSSRGRHVNFFFGAGTSRAAGLPDVKGLTDLILADLSEPLLGLAESMLKNRNLEEALTRIRRIRALLEPGQEFQGFTLDLAAELDQQFSTSIRKHLSAETAISKAHEDLSRWVVGDYYVRPIELFTVNYDLTIEQALEAVGAPYFDGFVGNLQAGFRADLVEATGTPADASPSSFARVWKLHGSLNWQVNEKGQIRRTGSTVKSDAMAAIYPSDEKYDQSRRVPFTVLQDRFRKALATPESITLIDGYSFGDQHLNEIIFDAARRYPRSEIIVFCYSSVYPQLDEVIAPNLSVLAAEEAIISGERRPWDADLSMPEEIWKDGKFRLGDFSALARFLSHTLRVEDWSVETIGDRP